MASPIAGAIIGAGGSLLGSAIDGIFNNYQAGKSFERSKELMDMSNRMGIENWRMENEYNLPKNQISRLREAGINPDLFYGGSSVNTMSSDISSVPSGSSPVAHPIDTNLGESTLHGMMLDAQIDNLNSQTRKNNADAGYVEEQTPWVSKQIQSVLDLNASNTKVLNEQVEKVRNENELLQWQSKISANEYQIKDALKDSFISKSLAEHNASVEQSRVVIDNYAKLYVAQIKLAVAQSYASYVNSDANRMNAQTNMRSQQLDAIIRHGELSVKRLQYDLDRSMKDAHIDNLNLQNQWRRQLNEVPVLGEAIHGLLSIPGGWFSSVK